MGISLEQAFEAVLDDEVFLDLMRGYAQRIGAKGFAAGFSISGNAVDSIFAYENDWSTDMLADYTAHFAHKDPWTLNIAHQDTARAGFIDVADFVADDQWGRSELYNDLLRANGDDTYRALATCVEIPGGMGGITFYRGRGQERFSDRELAILQADKDDLRHLIGLRAALTRSQAQATNWRDLVDRFSAEAFVLDSRMWLLDCNAMGQEMLESGGGLMVNRGYLYAAHPPSQRALEEAVQRAVNGRASDAQVVTVGSGPSARRFQLLATVGDGPFHRIILLGDLPVELGAQIEQALRLTYRLSPAEAALMRRLASGETPGEVAEARSVSVDTIRTQYRSAMAKMDVDRLNVAILKVRSLSHMR